MERPLDPVAREAVGGLQLPHRDHDRRLADNPVLPVDQLTQLRQRLQAVMGVGLGERLLAFLLGPPGRLLFASWSWRPWRRGASPAATPPRSDAHTRPPSAPSGRSRPSPPDRPSPIPAWPPWCRLGEAVVAGGDGEAGRQPLDVVLEGPGGSRRSRSGRTAARRSGEANTPNLTGARPHTAARSARRWGCGQVGGHDLGRAPVEGERRHQHPPMPHGTRSGSRVRLSLEQTDRVRPVRGRCPAGVAGQRRPVARLQPPGSAIIDARMRNPSSESLALPSSPSALHLPGCVYIALIWIDGPPGTPNRTVSVPDWEPSTQPSAPDQRPSGSSSRTPWAASAPALVGLPLRMNSKPTAIIAPMIGPTR